MEFWEQDKSPESEKALVTFHLSVFEIYSVLPKGFG